MRLFIMFVILIVGYAVLSVLNYKEISLLEKKIEVLEEEKDLLIRLANDVGDQRNYVHREIKKFNDNAEKFNGTVFVDDGK